MAAFPKHLVWCHWNKIEEFRAIYQEWACKWGNGDDTSASIPLGKSTEFCKHCNGPSSHSHGLEPDGEQFLSSTCLWATKVCRGSGSVRQTARVDRTWVGGVSPVPCFTSHFVAKTNCLQRWRPTKDRDGSPSRQIHTNSLPQAVVKAAQQAGITSSIHPLVCVACIWILKVVVLVVYEFMSTNWASEWGWGAGWFKRRASRGGGWLAVAALEWKHPLLNRRKSQQ